MSLYEELVEHLFSLNRSREKKSNLETTKQLAAALGNPQDQYPTIHIAGTNGKGSTLCKIGEALRLAGYRVGLFTSPHIFSYRERIVVDEEMVSEDEVVCGLQELFQLTQDLGITPKFFELTTLLAWNHFAQKKVDVALIETGLGGRLDATNILHPILSIITTIGLDHQEILGGTLDAIAREKGGIIKEKTPVVVGPTANRSVVREIARMKKAPLHPVEPFEEENQDIALKALELLSSHFIIGSEAKWKGLQKTPRCRFEVIDERIILDVAHNPSAFERLFENIHQKPISLLFSLSKEKDLSSLVPLFNEHVQEIALFPSSHPRLMKPEQIAKELELGGYQKWRVFQAVDAALQTLLNQEGMLLVAGSFYMMDEVSQSLKRLASSNIM